MDLCLGEPETVEASGGQLQGNLTSSLCLQQELPWNILDPWTDEEQVHKWIPSPLERESLCLDSNTEYAPKNQEETSRDCRTVNTGDGDPAINLSEQSSQRGDLTTEREVHTEDNTRQAAGHKYHLESMLSHDLLSWMLLLLTIQIFLLPGSSAASVDNNIELKQGSPGSFILAFPWTPNDDSSSYFTVALVPDQPFYTSVHQSLDPAGLRSKSQFDRFTISIMKTEGEMHVSIEITIVSSEDGGVYTVTIVSYRNGIYNYSPIIRTEVDVYPPIGRAECTTHKHGRVVYCQAAAGRNTNLICHQNGVKLRHQAEIYYDGYSVHGWFLNQLKNSSIYCCSHANNTEIDLNTCQDFVWHPRAPKMQNRQVTHANNNFPVTTGEPGQDYFSRTSDSGSLHGKTVVANILLGLWCVWCTFGFAK
ncbi:uncharacterized protein [Diadema antillarum]|uniref:uncharacterized protein n=1 Tax=Diadema antillarum TaxID=105358 RepID=UPI003A8A5862